MSDDLMEIWADGVDVEEWTPTDLTEMRTDGTSVVSDDNQLYQYAYRLKDHLGLQNLSLTLDYTIRVYLAYCMDTGHIPDLRETYGVKYLIPPPGWVSDQSYEELRMMYDVDEDVGMAINVSLPPSVKEMLDDAVEDGNWATVTDFAEDALTFLTEGENTSQTRDVAKESPLALTELFCNKSRRVLVDFFLTSVEEDARLYKTDIVERTGLSRQSVVDNVD